MDKDKMTAQKDLFNRIPSGGHGFYPIDTVNTTNGSSTDYARRRQRIASCLLILAGILVLLAVTSIVGFLCWKGTHTCGEYITTDSMKPAAISTSDDYIDIAAAEDTGAPWFPPPTVSTTTMRPETSVRAPPASTPTSPPSSSSDDAEMTSTTSRGGSWLNNGDRLPWFARLPLIGWMFRATEDWDDNMDTVKINVE